MLYSEVEDSLSHIGVKGMRWGHRKAEGVNSASPASKTPKVKMSGREKRAAAKKFYEDRMNNALETAVKDPNSLINVHTPGGAMVVTGKEFTNYLSRGGIVNAHYTDVFAKQDTPDGEYRINEKMGQSYKRSLKTSK